MFSIVSTLNQIRVFINRNKRSFNRIEELFLSEEVFVF